MTAESSFVHSTLLKQIAIAEAASAVLKVPIILFDRDFVEQRTVMANSIRVSLDANGRHAVLSAGAQAHFDVARYLCYMREVRVMVERETVLLPYPYDPLDTTKGFQKKVIGLEYEADENVEPLQSLQCSDQQGCTSEKCANGCTTPVYPPDHPWFQPGGCPTIRHLARDLMYISLESGDVCKM